MTCKRSLPHHWLHCENWDNSRDNLARVLPSVVRKSRKNFVYFDLFQLSHFNHHIFQFVKTLPKRETENFASVLPCFKLTYLCLSHQFLLGKLAWGLSYAHGNTPCASHFQYKEKRKQEVIRIVIYCVWRIMGTPHEPKWGNGGPMSHLGSPRSETRYHLLCSIIFGAQCSQVTGWEWTLTRKTVVAIGPPTGHELRYGTRSDIHLQRVLLSHFESMIFRTSRLVGYVSVPWKNDTPHPAITCDSQGNYHWAVRTGAIKEAIGLNVALRVNRETLLCLPQRLRTFKKMSSAPHPTKQTMLVVCWFSDSIIYPSILPNPDKWNHLSNPMTSEFATQAIPPYRFNQSASAGHLWSTYCWWFSCKERNGSDNFTHTFATSL